MKIIEKILIGITLVLAVVALASFTAQYEARRALNEAAGEPARAKVTFPGANEVQVEVPSVVRGKRITCFIFIDTKRRISSVNC